MLVAFVEGGVGHSNPLADRPCMDIAPILDAAFSMPGAILIRRDTNNFRNDSDIGYEIGIQQPRQHKRFVNVFRHCDDGAIYFKHDRTTVQALYAQHPQSILPSEISRKHWSRALFDSRLSVDMYVEFLTTSYNLVLGTLTKKGRTIVEGITDQEMRFANFHAVAMEYEAKGNVYAHYTDDAFGGPAISVGANRVIRYQYNSLACACDPHVLDDIDSITLDGETTVSADLSLAEWETAIRRVLDYALGH